MAEWPHEKYLAAVEIADGIVKEVISFEIDEPWTNTFKACCLFFFISRTGTKSWERISLAFRKKITWQDCTNISFNWRAAKRWNGHHFYMEISDDNHLQNVIELTLFCMVGAGELKCIQVDKEEKIDPSKLLKAV
jgi:hypothetical protein